MKFPTLRNYEIRENMRY